MVEKYIRSLLMKKVEDWASSIEDKDVAEIVRKNTVITGGCIASLMQGEQVNDFDVYLRNYDSAYKVAEYYVKRFNDRVKTKKVKLLDARTIQYLIDGLDNTGKEMDANEKSTFRELLDIQQQLAFNADLDGKRMYLYVASSGFATDSEDTESEVFDNVHDTPEMQDTSEDAELPKYRVRYISSNAITLSHKIQIVTRFYGDPDKIHDTYDFEHTKGYYTSWDKQLVIPIEVYRAVMNKTLIYTGSRYPIASIVRTRKFLQRGWTVNAGQYLKMAYQVAQLDMNNIAVLQDQLVGVDSAYFSMLIKALKELEGDIDYGRIVTIIDRIF